MHRAILLALFATAQSPTFEVVSVKREPPPQVTGSTFAGRFTGCRLVDPTLYICTNATVALMAFQAYDLKQYQLPNANDDTDKYTLQAKVAPGATGEDVRLMLRNLLAERFQLKFHYQNKEAQVYELAVSKNGLKLKEALPGAAPAPAIPGKDSDGFPNYPYSPGSTMGGRSNGLQRITGQATNVGSLASFLSNQLQTPVFDTTGLNGKYDYVLTFVLDPAGPAEGLTVFAALEKQLGLTLEKKKRDLDMFIIDQVDKSAAEN